MLRGCKRIPCVMFRGIPPYNYRGIPPYNSKAIGLSELEALANFNLAPFTVRRQIAALGALHRRVLGDAPAPIAALFPFAL